MTGRSASRMQSKVEGWRVLIPLVLLALAMASCDGGARRAKVMGPAEPEQVDVQLVVRYAPWSPAGGPSGKVLTGRPDADDSYWQTHDADEWSTWSAYGQQLVGSDASLELEQLLSIEGIQARGALSVQSGPKFLLVTCFGGGSVRYAGVAQLYAAPGEPNQAEIELEAWGGGTPSYDVSEVRVAVFHLAELDTTGPGELTYDGATRDDIAALQGELSEERIVSTRGADNQIPNGSLLFLVTDDGNFGKMRVIQNEEIWMTFAFVVYGSDGEVLAESDSSSVNNTWTYDLETDTAGGGQAADFWWEWTEFHGGGKPGDPIYLTPKNGALYAVVRAGPDGWERVETTVVQPVDGTEPVELTNAAGERMRVDFHIDDLLPDPLYSGGDTPVRPYLTPNGDGVGDVSSVGVDLEVLESVDLRVSVMALSGDSLRTLGNWEASTDAYSASWDGVDANGDLVRPGTYIYRVSATREDTVVFEHRRTVDVFRDVGDTTAVVFADSALERLVREAIEKPEGELTAADVAALGRLDIGDSTVVSLQDLELLPGLDTLFIGVPIEDLSVLSSLDSLGTLAMGPEWVTDLSMVGGLTSLRALLLFSVRATDISPLAGLTSLRMLLFLDTPLSDLTPLSQLTDLTHLALLGCGVVDVDPLSGLTRLDTLDLSGNQITDLTPLAGLDQLRLLSLNTNNVTDVSPLLDNTGLGAGDLIDLTDNSLNEEAYSTHIPALEARGVEVTYDELALPITFPDAALEELVRETIDKPEGELTTADVSGITRLSGSWGAGIASLEGIQHLASLEELYLSGNDIVDLTPIASLTQLRRIGLMSNDVADVIPLGGLVLLEHLDLSHNPVEDLSILDEIIHNLPQLTSLSVQGMGVTNVTFLGDLTNLTSLYLNNNQIDDVTPLSSLTQLESLGMANSPNTNLADLEQLVTGLPGLTYLALWGMGLTDVSFLGGMSGLTSLTLANNSISDLSPSAGLLELQTLYLYSNDITDLSPLSGLTQLRQLYLGDNQISDLSPLQGLLELSRLELENNDIADLSPLVANSGIDSGDDLVLSGNPLNSQAYDEYIPALEGRGVAVQYDEQALPSLFADAALEERVRETVGKPDGELTVADVSGVTQLAAWSLGITSLEGLEHLVSLVDLDLSGNDIVDLTPIAGLTG
ncbi:leucine-rich repeat domain-containing protein, partial [Candidatus Latescibacterota bacterium]